MVQIKRTEQSQTSLPQTQNFQFAFQSQGRQLADNVVKVRTSYLLATGQDWTFLITEIGNFDTKLWKSAGTKVPGSVRR